MFFQEELKLHYNGEMRCSGVHYTVEDRYSERRFSAFLHYSATLIHLEKTLKSILNTI